MQQCLVQKILRSQSTWTRVLVQFQEIRLVTKLETDDKLVTSDAPLRGQSNHSVIDRACQLFLRMWRFMVAVSLCVAGDPGQVLETQHSTCRVTTEEIVATASATVTRVLTGLCSAHDVEVRLLEMETGLSRQLQDVRGILQDLITRLDQDTSDHSNRAQDRTSNGLLLPNKSVRTRKKENTQPLLAPVPSPRDEEVDKFNCTVNTQPGVDSPVFTYYWRVEDIITKMTIWSPGHSLRSPSFYTPPGYRMYLRVSPNQPSSSLMVHAGLTRGQFDPSLNWPFPLRHRVEVIGAASSRLWDPGALCGAQQWRRPIGGDNTECSGLGIPSAKLQGAIERGSVLVKLSVYLPPGTYTTLHIIGMVCSCESGNPGGPSLPPPLEVYQSTVQGTIPLEHQEVVGHRWFEGWFLTARKGDLLPAQKPITSVTDRLSACLLVSENQVSTSQVFAIKVSASQVFVSQGTIRCLRDRTGVSESGVYTSCEAGPHQTTECLVGTSCEARCHHIIECLLGTLCEAGPHQTIVCLLDTSCDARRHQTTECLLDTSCEAICHRTTKCLLNTSFEARRHQTTECLTSCALVTPGRPSTASRRRTLNRCHSDVLTNGRASPERHKRAPRARDRSHSYSFRTVTGPPGSNTGKIKLTITELVSLARLRKEERMWSKILVVMTVLLVCAVAARDACHGDNLAVYNLTLQTNWTEKLFPKHFPEWRPPAQWSGLVAVELNTTNALANYATEAGAW
uniref:Spondin domain-containing protein n=1 Tax=Timema douglasi TaxID=61478 RepID=A0A7R8VPM6_TIMDO|nr:unnamed protein product [Timema douglasi]